ncbi:hypothetical protein Tco_0874554 [Tanacetum coccineum]|uniref:Retrovirus-related Pol polyprotein from transposon TNT 1-94 n=1 Tax=Tanacetum coccineum TaxID=301880 RepID=A0ABQ5BMQ1_9ASTR
METRDTIGTPMEIKDKLDLDQNGTLIDATKYRSMIGALMYLTSSRPDIVHATCLCARYQAKPTEKHLKEVKRIFRYLHGTVNMGLWYTKDSGFELTGFSDADYAKCKDSFKIPIHCDLKSAIAISCNPVQHSRTKHIVVRYHFIKEHVEKGTIELYSVKTDYQLADLFTKALSVDRFTYLVHRLGIRSLSPQELECLTKSRYDYGYLEEIVVRREDDSIHKLKECDFPNVNLRDIKDMLLLLVQKKLSNLSRDALFDLNVALRMCTRRVFIQKQVEDLQLGVEIYQKKLNITKPDNLRSNISNETLYTPYNNPRGFIYQDKFKRNRLMRADELYKFCDGTLTSVISILQDIVSGLNMRNLPMKRWSEREKSRSRVMIKAIDKQLYERWLMRNLEKFVGGREYGEDFRLLERTV